MLSQKIDQKETLEEQRIEKAKIIKKINQEFEPEIMSIKDVTDKYERKLMVNVEKKDALESEKQTFEKQQEEFNQKLKHFDEINDGYANLTKQLKATLKAEEKEYEKFDRLVTDHHHKVEEHEALTKEIHDLKNEQKSNEQTIAEYETELAEHCAKIDEHDKMLEGLESEKKILAMHKKFKEAKRTKDLIVMKTEHKNKLQKRIEEIKYLKDGIEKCRVRNEKIYEKLVKDQAESQLELKNLEYQILLQKYMSLEKSIKLKTPTEDQSKLLDLLSSELASYTAAYDFKPPSKHENLLKVSVNPLQESVCTPSESEKSPVSDSIKFDSPSSIIAEIEKLEQEIKNAVDNEDFDLADELSEKQADLVKQKESTIISIENEEEYCQVKLDKAVTDTVDEHGLRQFLDEIIEVVCQLDLLNDKEYDKRKEIQVQKEEEIKTEGIEVNKEKAEATEEEEIQQVQAEIQENTKEEVLEEKNEESQEESGTINNEEEKLDVPEKTDEVDLKGKTVKFSKGAIKGKF